ncbi:protein yellow isoform X2 [Ceratitis capitata]|nr:protein yellow isoform X2 [Ceratitis capitata]XP_012158994.1 protein yellow isoform X2 [Ceratitis capitata]XP_012158995.1 protein yellow isoform X2 [Ceratitis capitata]XP_020715607.1 protein yellow isoform X2 [Ceratitis capitata]XP_020715608.1 protein yellow isoform X2 [Ceratitis capitata]
MWTRFLILLLLALTPQAIISVKQRDLETVYQWKQLVYGFATPADRQHAQSNGYLVPENGTPIDVATHQQAKGSRVFVTIPRFQTGIPYTLAVVSDSNEANGPVLQPYPDYSYHNAHGRDCNKITSAFRVAITECNQMFVIDSGVIGMTQHCPPQLLVFDLNTDTLYHRYRFESSMYVPIASLLITPLVVVQDPPPKGRCRRLHVYIADVTHHGLVIYDSELNTAWRAENKFMYPDPDHGQHTIAGDNFILMDGMFALATDQRQLYFHPLASISEYAVPLSVLNNRTMWMDNLEAMPEAFRLVGRRSSECAAQAMDSHRNLYCVTFNPIKLIRWNPSKPYNVKYEIEVPADPQLLEFVSGMKVFKNDAGKEELWMISNRYQKVATGTLTDSEVNFRVVRRPLDDIQSQHPPIQDLSQRLIFT